jgi:hypothetical protein
VEQFQKSGTVPLFKGKKWNCFTFFGSRDSKAEQLYEKVKLVLKAGDSSAKCGTATHISVHFGISVNSEGMIGTSCCFQL